MKATRVQELVTGAAICAVCACGDPPPQEDDDDESTSAMTPSSEGPVPTPTTGEPTTSEVTTGMPSDTTGGTTTAETDDEMTSGMPPDIFGPPVIPDAPPVDTTCTMVDFMFVIDNSGSMSSSQMNLIANFPAFITGIQDSLDSVDSYHVGVITTDEYNQNIAGCQNLSSLVVNSSGGACGPYAEGENYMTDADDLGTAFSCAGNVGTSGAGLELPMQAMVEAVQEVDGGPGQCNEGFLRDDSLLVIVIITDEYDGPGDPEGVFSPGDPTTWYDDVVAARGGIPENIVVLSLINYMGGPCPPITQSFDGVNIMDFTNMFNDNGFLGGICEPDYGPIFTDAIAVIDTACENFMPPQG